MIKSFTMTPIPAPPGPGAGTLIGKAREWGTGVALAGVQVTLLNSAGALSAGPVRTTADGSYSVAANPGTYTVAAVKAGYPSKYSAIVVPYLGTSSFSFFLKPSVAVAGVETYVQGTVTDSGTHLPIEGAAVVLTDPSIPPPAYVPPGSTPPVTIVAGPTLTDAAGYYRLDV